MFPSTFMSGMKGPNVLWVKRPEDLTCINNISIFEDISGTTYNLLTLFEARLTSRDFYLAPVSKVLPNYGRDGDNGQETQDKEETCKLAAELMYLF